jgi:hypothetical protein
MSAVAVTLAQWVEFASVHVNHPLSFIIFSLLLQKLVKPLQNGLITEDEVTEQTSVKTQATHAVFRIK